MERDVYFSDGVSGCLLRAQGLSLEWTERSTGQEQNVNSEQAPLLGAITACATLAAMPRSECQQQYKCRYFLYSPRLSEIEHPSRKAPSHQPRSQQPTLLLYCSPRPPSRRAPDDPMPPPPLLLCPPLLSLPSPPFWPSCCCVPSPPMVSAAVASRCDRSICVRMVLAR